MSSQQARPKETPGVREITLASITRRFLAWLLDVVVVTILIFAALSLIGAIVGPAVRIHLEAATLEDAVAADLGRLLLDAVVATGLSAAYFVIPWVLVGGSPAQIALRMRVGFHEGNGPLPVGRALTRWILLFPPFATVSALTAGVPGVGAVIWLSAVVWYVVLLLTTVRSETRQGLHDRIAASIVRMRGAEAAYRIVDVR